MTTSPARLRTARFAAQGIAAPGLRPAEAVERMLAVQGQDLGQVLWAIGVRAPGSTRDDVRAAFDRGELVRSWPMRGTLHALRPDDLRLLLSLTAERTLRTIARRAAELGIDDALLGQARDATIAALVGGRALVRDDLFAAYRAAGIDPSGGRGYHLVLQLAQEGLVAWGPTARVGQGLVLLDEWAPAAGALPDRDEALRRVLLGYLRGRGPATEVDAASWTKLPLGDLRRARAAAGDAVEDLGDGLLDLADRPASARPAAARVPTGHLLPGFDEYLLGYADRSAQLDPALADRVVPGANGMFLPMAVVRGRVVGTWKRTERRAGHLVTVTPFGALDASSVRALEAAAARYAGFLGAPVATTVV
ncbi:winged helix DNA-binding domain-containing protein [Curtobacterium sp. BRB10]|uniref:winged helix DNA-binding domain-containing protein n=1 Tax=Curtobacterium sp. BRB10 TaxID=2962579 RepID=UPI002880ED71|nr:winged helix DNA-binding domain-containing protein [Curtobacterium sp. BRB10]MDT0234517.1 winged helix DNA-binding domain-containing protein [Curtobacterium sp. BRB10]